MTSHGSKGPIRTAVEDYSLPLIGGVIAALVWANVSPHSYHHVVHWSPFGSDSHYNFHFLFNDIFMVFFFGIAAGEITEACLPEGALNPPRRAINPLLGTAGGVLGPVGTYFLWVWLTGDASIANGWGIPTATDIALAWLVARIVFGRGHPAVSFLLLLAVADDGIGLAIIAIFYPDPANPTQPVYLLLVLAAMASAYALRRRRVESVALYVFGPGVLSWTGLYLAHLHPALALVAVVPFMPAADHDIGMYAEDEDRGSDPLNRFHHYTRLPVDLGLLGFGLANAGVLLSAIGNATWAVLVALAIGKTVGIFAFSMLGHRWGFQLPYGMDGVALFLVGLIAGLGLTVALFVAGEAFTDPDIQSAAKMGALMSAVIAPVAIILARILRVRSAEQLIAEQAREDADSSAGSEATA